VVIKKMVLKSKKVQSFSTDILVVVVIILFGFLFLVMNKINTEQSVDINVRYEQADVDSKAIFDSFKSNEILDSENKVDVKKLMSMDQNQIKEDLGIRNDFAIVFEKDGKLVKIDPENNINCIGSSDIIINEVSCN